MRYVMAIACAIVLMIASPSAAQAGISATGAPSPLDLLLQYLQQLEQQIQQALEWLWSLTSYTDAARESLAPVLDRVYAAQELAARLESLAAALPDRTAKALRAMAGRLRSITAPRHGTPRWVVEQLIQADPASETAQQAKKLDQVGEHNAIAQASARSAAESAYAAARQVIADRSPQVDAQAAVAAARELALRAQSTPSTRAAVQLLIEAMAVQLDQQARMGTHVTGRQAALVQQQALLSQQLAAVVDRMVAAIDQQNAQQKEQLARRSAAAVAVVESQRQTYGEITQSLLALNSSRRQEAMDAFFAALTGRR